MKKNSSMLKTIAFEDQRHKAIVNILFTNNCIIEDTLRVLKPFELNDKHYNILKVLAEHHPDSLNMGEVKAALFDNRGDLTRLLDKLEKMNLVERLINIENRRVVDVTISELGLNSLIEIDQTLRANHKQRNNLNDQEAEQLNQLLEKFRGE